MTIKWNNVGVAILLLGGCIMYFNWGDYVQKALGCFNDMTTGTIPDDRMFGVIVLGLLCLTFVCIVRLLRNQ